MAYLPPAACKRRAAVLALAALLLVFIVGMASFMVDVGYIVYVRSELQNAADASALAAAEQLMQPYTQYNLPLQSASQKATILQNAESNAQAKAKSLASYNKAGDVTGLTLLDADIVFGFVDSNGVFHSNPPDNRYPNSVQVTARRDSQANTSLGLFFGWIFGKSSADVVAMGQASIMENPSRFSGAGPFLPVALDYNVWSQFMTNGTSPSANNQVLTGPNGQPQLQVYPDSGTLAGGFGLVSIGAPATDDPSFANWITNGSSTTDVQYLNDHNLLPVSLQQPENWPRGPGMKSNLVDDFAAIEGQVRLLPLYDPTNAGSGSYPIVGFAGVTITQATGNGSNMIIAVQPKFISVSDGTGGSPAGSSGLPPTFSFTWPALTK